MQIGDSNNTLHIRNTHLLYNKNTYNDKYFLV